MDTTLLERREDGFKPGHVAIVRGVPPQHSTGGDAGAHTAVEVARTTVHFVRHGQGVHNLKCEHEESLCKRHVVSVRDHDRGGLSTLQRHELAVLVEVSADHRFLTSDHAATAWAVLSSGRPHDFVRNEFADEDPLTLLFPVRAPRPRRHAARREPQIL